MVILTRRMTELLKSRSLVSLWSRAVRSLPLAITTLRPTLTTAHAVRCLTRTTTVFVMRTKFLVARLNLPVTTTLQRPMTMAAAKSYVQVARMFQRAIMIRVPIRTMAIALILRMDSAIAMETNSTP